MKKFIQEMKKEEKKQPVLIKIQLTQHEIQQAMKSNVYKNKKKYNRKTKHKGYEERE